MIKKVIKTTFLVLAAIIVLFIASLFVFSNFYGEKISNIVITELNKRLNVKVSVGSIEFSMFKHFPSASVSLNNVTVFSSETFNKKEFKTDPRIFLTSKHLSLQFNILDVLKKKYTINKIDLVDSKVQIFIDKKGRNNLKLFKADTSKNTATVTIDLKKVKAENCEYHYISNESSFYCDGFIESCLFKGRFASNNYTLETTLKGTSKHVGTKDHHFPTDIAVELESSLQIVDSTYTINKCNLSLNEIETKVIGNIQKRKFYYVNLNTKIEYARFSEIAIYLPETIQHSLKTWKPEGDLQLTVKTKGSITNNELPAVKINFTIENGTFYYKNQENKVRCKGLFDSKNIQDITASTLQFDTITLDHKNSSYAGRITISDFKNYHLKSTGKIQLHLEDIVDFTDKKQIESKGLITGSISIETDLNKLDSINEHLFEKLDMKSDLEIRNGSFSSKPYPYAEISNLRAAIKTNNDTYSIDSCQFNYFGSQMQVHGKISNVLKYLLTGNQPLNGELTVKSNCIDYNKILESIPKDSAALVLPFVYNVKVSFETECLKYQKIQFQNLKGQFSYTAGGIKVENFSFFVFDGRINGDVYLSQMKNKGFEIKSKLTTTNIHVDKIFTAMNNFNQKTLVDKNLKGLITSDITISAELNNDFSLKTKTLLMECSAVIMNGRLLNFEPMKKLSKFVDISELDDVSFSTLKNNFVIKDEKITIPQMEIKSSALRLQIAGTHQFSNNFEYNVQVYISELLAKKHKTKHPDEYFGEVVDDGSVQTRLPLKIIGTPTDIKVSYDTKTAKENVKETFKKEKTELSRIFKEEFGSTKKDTAIQKKTPTKKPEEKQKFEIEFE